MFNLICFSTRDQQLLPSQILGSRNQKRHHSHFIAKTAVSGFPCACGARTSAIVACLIIKTAEKYYGAPHRFLSPDSTNKMGIGIIEPRQLVVPGTIQLYDSNQHAGSTEHLKHTADGKTVLAPQPSDSPNDPLNWSLWKKDFVFVILLIGTICSTIHGPLLSPVTVTLSEEFGVSINDIAQLSSYMLLIIAVSAYVFAALANVLGKRGIFVFAMATLVAADAWAATASGYHSLFGARMFSGVGQGAFECLALSNVPDLYFVHQRSKRIALFWIFLQTGVYLGVPIGTQIINNSGWHMAFTALAIT